MIYFSAFIFIQEQTECFYDSVGSVFSSVHLGIKALEEF